MIPLDTPAGTEVVCIDASSPRSAECPTQIFVGQIYTVHGWTKELMTNKPLVDLVENFDEEWAWEPERFRLLDVAGLDALLDVKEGEPA